MGRIAPQTLPPGTSFYFATERDELGNENYVGPPLTIGPTGEPLPQAVPPSYASAPANGVTNTNPLPIEPPGSKVFNEHLREGLRLLDTGVRKLSTGELSPTEASGWTNSNNIKKSDDVRASDVNAGSGYGDVLNAAGFDFSSIPADAVITGIKVRVERSKV